MLLNSLLTYVKKNTWLLALLLLALLLFCFSPYEYRIYPSCPFKILTGKDCIFCGTTRAFYHILHLELQAAWAMNKLAFFILFFVVFKVIKNILKTKY